MRLYDVAAEFERRAQTCSNDRELQSLLEDASRDLGFAYYAIVHSVSFRRENSTFISLDNYPQSWAEEFVGGRLYVDDPVLQASQRTTKAFRWANVSKLLKVDARHNHVL